MRARGPSKCLPSRRHGGLGETASFPRMNAANADPALARGAESSPSPRMQLLQSFAPPPYPRPLGISAKEISMDTLHFSLRTHGPSPPSQVVQCKDPTARSGEMPSRPSSEPAPLACPRALARLQGTPPPPSWGQCLSVHSRPPPAARPYGFAELPHAPPWSCPATHAPPLHLLRFWM